MLYEVITWILKRGLTGGHLDVRAVASELGMSDRTLQRRLTEEGTTFKQLLNQVRHEQALEYLADPTFDIKEVAFLIGYEDQNSFYRAFRLWEGKTPSNWRSDYFGIRITSYNVCYTKLLRQRMVFLELGNRLWTKFKDQVDYFFLLI